jgi:hypothetical protein
MEENRYGFHGRGRQGHNHNTGNQGAMAPGGAAGKKHMSEPTNHAGHTHEMARRHEHDGRVESMRNAHAGHGPQAHEKILHESHKLHQNPGQHISHGSKHGEAHHVREEHDREPSAHHAREESAGHVKERGREMDE